MLFRGFYCLSIDVKGRIAIPTRFRDQLLELSSGNVVFTADPDGCLLIYPTPQWEENQKKLESLPTFDPIVRKIQRFYIGQATDCEMDTQGRVLVPGNLREYARLDKKAVLLGQGRKFELWDEDKWNALSSSITEEDLLTNDTLGDALAGISL